MKDSNGNMIPTRKQLNEHRDNCAQCKKAWFVDICNAPYTDMLFDLNLACDVYNEMFEIRMDAEEFDGVDLKEVDQAVSQ